MKWKTAHNRRSRRQRFRAIMRARIMESIRQLDAGLGIRVRLEDI